MARITAITTARIVKRAPATKTNQCCFSRAMIRSPSDEKLLGIAHRASFLLSGPRVGLAVDVPDPFAGHVRVQLGRGDTRMSEQLLDDPQVGAALEQVRRERVPQRVRA